MMQQHLRSAPSIKKQKSVYSQRSLGTIKDRKREKVKEKEVSNGDTIMRILRMRFVFLGPFVHAEADVRIDQSGHAGIYHTTT